MQIRLHLAHLGHPILGDDMYGLRVRCATGGIKHACTIVLQLLAAI